MNLNSKTLKQCLEFSILQVKYYKLIGRFEFSFIPPAPRGVPIIEVTFSIEQYEWPAARLTFQSQNFFYFKGRAASDFLSFVFKSNPKSSRKFCYCYEHIEHQHHDVTERVGF